jgi:hypothetical protein
MIHVLVGQVKNLKNVAVGKIILHLNFCYFILLSVILELLDVIYKKK